MKNDNTPAKSPLFAITKGLLTTFAITAAVMVCCAAVMTLGSGLNENTVYIAVHITSLAAVFAGALTAARNIQSRGMLNGLAVGIIYTIATVFAGFMITPDYSVGTKTLLTLGISLASGALGGILGINMK